MTILTIDPSQHLPAIESGKVVGHQGVSAGNSSVPEYWGDVGFEVVVPSGRVVEVSVTAFAPNVAPNAGQQSAIRFFIASNVSGGPASPVEDAADIKEISFEPGDKKNLFCTYVGTLDTSRRLITGANPTSGNVEFTFPDGIEMTITAAVKAD